MDKVQVIEIGLTRGIYTQKRDPWITFELNDDAYMHWADKRDNPHIWGFRARPTISDCRLKHIDSCLDYAYSQHVVDMFNKALRADKVKLPEQFM